MPCQTLTSRRLWNNGTLQTVPAQVTVRVRQSSTCTGTVHASGTRQTGGHIAGSKPVVVCTLSTWNGIRAGLWAVVSLGTDISVGLIDGVLQNGSSAAVVTC